MAFLLISFWWDLLICVDVLLVLLFVYVKYQHGYWKKKGLSGPDPTFLVGNIGNVISGKRVIGERFSELYFQTKDKPYVGVFMMLRQTLMVNDLEQVKTILVKDFAHFTDHSFEMSEKHEPLANHLFNLGGERWKNLRIKMTPTFTTSKMKMMFDSINSCADVMKNYLVNDIKDGQIEDVKEILAKFSTDVIGCCAFGIECDSFKNPNSQFRKMGKRVFHMPFHKAILQMLLFFFPSMISKVNFSILGSDVNSFFYNLVKNTIEHREKNNIVRNDFLQLLMELRKEESAVDGVDGM